MYSDGLIELLNLNAMKKIWILIYVTRGLIQEPEIFLDEISASKRKQKILKNFNHDYDEVEVYEKQINKVV